MGCAQPAERLLRHMKYNTEGNVLSHPNAPRLGFVTVLDLHLSPTTPASRKDDFLEATLDALRQAMRLAVKMNCVGMIFAGDVFHLKTPGRNPNWFMKRVIEEFVKIQEAGLVVLGVAGNHDLVFGSLASLDQQPIGVLTAAGAFHLLDDRSVLFEANGFSVRVAGSSFEHSKAEKVRDLKKDGATFLVSVGHFWFGPKTGEFYGEPMYGPDYLGNSECDAYVIGHHHIDQGIPRIGDKLYFSHGSINRIGSHEGDADRIPAVGYLEVTAGGITGKIGRLKVPPFADVFDLEKNRAIKEEKKELEEFMSSLSENITFSADVPGILEAMILTVEVREQVNLYIAEAEGSVG